MDQIPNEPDFYERRRQLAFDFTTCVQHVQKCELIQYNNCDHPYCESTVQIIEHFAACQTRTRRNYKRTKRRRTSRKRKAEETEEEEKERTSCARCLDVVNVLIHHSLSCDGLGADGDGRCFVPNCSRLKSLVQRRRNPRHLAKHLLARLSEAEIRTVVWCLGGGDPQHLELSTGKNEVRWLDCGDLL